MPTEDEYQDYITNFNSKLKQLVQGEIPVEEVEEEFKKYVTKYVKPYTEAEWSISMFTKFYTNQICVLANSARGERCLAIIDKDFHREEGRYNLKYTFRKIWFKNNDPKSIKWEPDSKNRHCQYSEKKGFWLWLVKKPLVVDIFNDSSKNKELLELYNKYVRGMEINPDDESVRVTRSEQFDMNYPTPEWIEAVNDTIECKQKNSKAKKPKKK